ncbi:MAG: ABC transporter substrate-binding protein [Verrucomicrobiia bacterium]
MTYTLKLRERARFRESTPLGANAAAFSFLRQMDKSHPAHLKQATFACWSPMYSIGGIVQGFGLDTLQFHLHEPHAPFLANLAILPAYLISLKFIDHQRAEVGPPKIQRLIFKVVPDSATRLIQLQTDQIQVMDGIDPNDLPVIERDQSPRLVTAQGLNVCHLSFNCEKPPLNDRNLRRAIAAAINKKRSRLRRLPWRRHRRPKTRFRHSFPVTTTPFPSAHHSSTPLLHHPARCVWRS